MKVRNVYLSLAIIGVIFPYSQLIPFIMENGLDVGLMVNMLFVNRVSGFFGLGVMISGLALIFFILMDTRTRDVPHSWIALIGTLVVGISFGLPAYLYLKELEYDHEFEKTHPGVHI